MMWVFIFGDIFNKGIPFILLPIYTFFLSPHEMGIYNQYQFYFLLLNILVGGGVTLLYSINYQNREGQTSQFSLSEYGVVFFVLNLIMSALLIIADFFLSINPIYYLLPVCVFSQSIISIELITRQFSLDRLGYVKVQVATTLIINVFSSVFIWIYSQDSQGRVVGLSLAYLLVAIFLLAKSRNRPSKSTQQYLKEFTLSLYYLIPQCFEYLKNQFDKIIIIMLFTSSYLGDYSVLFQLISIVYIFMFSFEKAFLPRALVLSKSKNYIKLVKLLGIQTLLGLTILVFIMLSLDFIYGSLISDGYSYNYFFAMILGFSFVFKSISSFLVKMLLSLGFSRIVNVFNLLSFVVVSFFCFIFKNNILLPPIALVLVNLFFFSFLTVYYFFVGRNSN